MSFSVFVLFCIYSLFINNLNSCPWSCKSDSDCCPGISCELAWPAEHGYPALYLCDNPTNGQNEGLNIDSINDNKARFLFGKYNIIVFIGVLIIGLFVGFVATKLCNNVKRKYCEFKNGYTMVGKTVSSTSEYTTHDNIVSSNNV
mmetsp:Transcript_82119/g.100763  ORF Transcript_82119/g.100763 Transcript_82119/m.100763 type:complete len:145 (-) Transcript_82119:151-585(-)